VVDSLGFFASHNYLNDKLTAMSDQKSILICQHLTCRKQGSGMVLQAFRSEASSTEIACEGSGCLGRCGSGPNILVLPTQTWYHHVQQNEVSTILSQTITQ
jgi:(2Fe-2S) ferredoxin